VLDGMDFEICNLNPTVGTGLQPCLVMSAQVDREHPLPPKCFTTLGARKWPFIAVQSGDVNSQCGPGFVSFLANGTLKRPILGVAP